MILKVKRTYGISPYVVYCPSNFDYHTHCWNRDVAYIIKKNVDKLRVPKTKDIRLLKSHIRVTDNEEYISKLKQKICSLQTKGGITMETSNSATKRKVYVTKKFGFEAAHRLPNYKGACSNMHGHSYKLEVTLSGYIYDNYDSVDKAMVLDFKTLKRIVTEKITDIYDHKLLNEFFTFPTAEIMAVSIYYDICRSLENLPYELEKSKIKDFNDKYIKVESVKLWETEDSYAEYRGE